jgi:hypothetical protein
MKLVVTKINCLAGGGAGWGGGSSECLELVIYSVTPNNRHFPASGTTAEIRAVVKKPEKISAVQRTALH